MPGPISDSNPGPRASDPYVASHYYRKGPQMCPCGHHEGYHDDTGVCLHTRTCGCAGLPSNCLTPLGE